jgi:spermidine synthase
VPAIQSDFSSIDVRSAAELVGVLLMDSAHIAQYLDRSQSRQVVADDNTYLEYKTPFEFLGRTEAIVPDLIANAVWSEDEIFDAYCNPAFRSAARSVFSNRLPQILPELGGAIR